MEIEFNTASFKDFENVDGLDAWKRAGLFQNYLNYLDNNGRLNYRLISSSGCGPEMNILTKDHPKARKMVSFVSNDYLGFTQHPKIKAAVIASIEEFGSGAGASPAIGGQFSYHEDLEQKIAAFFGRESAIIYTTGYTANSATLMSLLQKEDIAIVDMAVHASVYEGCQLTNMKVFLHNRLDLLERTLKLSRDAYRTKMVIVDGVYSQDGDIAPLDKILELCRHYGAYLAVDDAHGVGVVGNTGRGAMEMYGILQEADIITGTFSKTFGNVGGYVIASPELINFLKYQSRQHLFSATSTPAAAGIIRGIELLDEEPYWKDQLWENINHFRNGLDSLGFDTGPTQSAIIPIKIGDASVTAQMAAILMKAGIYTNPIIYPAVSKKNARIRTSVMATHTKEQLDQALNAFEDAGKKLGIIHKDPLK
ncbi:aminotransferase class I/II-fold pyridoxal phosphate-dependent enzyme [Daejeonella sp.]|uniref:aminotransferase class I/II-fold pyridoxal phosphate-dependent enzyme n=1 Tax=Daejeonella sp. TaxID=2805397 RepID=UPI000BCB5E64|nr:aminotransferase class I/II-fold pyridoxal phosphate-dependent enzyme [Daejeonella sp.]OYX95245.1 MAG: 2-amino-3-ketobutyrate CoA ligase [Sphingobacteriia bacterium 35-40-5]HQT24882.1 aminotransferase class I/II-fold pyridoxal phosphate-dependent enzyme [Daejeonella sp.]HQT59484.1 aminotransferase class I/II-fold pyridoxal phosphate-dependent enzyme [Daejeonella sp.]